MGSATARQLLANKLANGRSVHGLIRSQEKGADLAALGAEIVIGDLRDPESLRRACQGVTTVIAAAHAHAAKVSAGINTTRNVHRSAGQGTFTVVHDATFNFAGFDNQGSFIKTGSSGVVSFNANRFTNDGSVSVEAGTLYLQGSTTMADPVDSGSYTAEPGALLRFGTVNRTVTADSSISAEEIWASSGERNIYGSYDVLTTTTSSTDDGSSWADAFTNLQDALSAAAVGDEIWVAAAVYKPTPVSTRRTAFFPLPNGVAIYGGFAGHESEREERDWQANVTVLSGDIDNNDVTDENGVTVHHNDIVGENSYRVVVGSGVDETAVLDGFTITGGMYLRHGDPALTNLTFTGNSSNDGAGGLYIRNSDLTLTNALFSQNQAIVRGGAMVIRSSNSSPHLTNVTFSHNNSQERAGALYFGGNGSHPVLHHVVFENNTAVADGGGLYIDSESVILTDVQFSQNSSTGDGGGIYNGTVMTMTNGILAGNIATYGGGLFIDDADVNVLTNVLFSGNRANSDGGGVGTLTASIANDEYEPSNRSISYSLVQGCNPGGDWQSACGTDGGNNLPDVDPLFIETPDPGAAPRPAAIYACKPTPRPLTPATMSIWPG